MIGWLFAACATPMLLPTHHAAELLEAPLGVPAPPSFAGRTVLLQFQGDESVVPVGALLDDYHRGVTPAVQSYVLSQPGLVLFESLAERLSAAGAEVYRAYPAPSVRPDALADAVIVEVTVAGLEFHRWRTTDGDFLLLGADVRWQIGGGTAVDRVQARVPVDQDVFVAAGDALATALHPRLP